MLTILTTGVNTPRAHSPFSQRASSQPPPTKSVHFDSTPTSSNLPSPPAIRKRGERASTSRHHDGYDSENGSSSRNRSSRNRDLPENDPREDRRRRRHRHSPGDSRTPSPAESDSTVDLPERFDERGRRKSEEANEDPLAKGIQELLSGRGSITKALQSFGLGGGSDDSDGDRRRRRRRR